MLKMPEISERLKATGLTPVGGTVEEFAERKKLVERVFGKVLKDAGVVPK